MINITNTYFIIIQKLSIYRYNYYNQLKFGKYINKIIITTCII
ncbi:MAG: hypothetical protein ACTTN6_01275 [Arsenophonus sp.]